MSPSPHDQPQPPATLQPYVAGQPVESGLTMILPPEAARPSWVLWLVALLAAAGLLASGLLWQKVSNMQEELARRSTDSGAQAVEARTLARQAEEATRELTARLAPRWIFCRFMCVGRRNPLVPCCNAHGPPVVMGRSGCSAVRRPWTTWWHWAALTCAVRGR